MERDYDEERQTNRDYPIYQIEEWERQGIDMNEEARLQRETVEQLQRQIEERRDQRESDR